MNLPVKLYHTLRRFQPALAIPQIPVPASQEVAKLALAMRTLNIRLLVSWLRKW
jgi:hypothetical protein